MSGKRWLSESLFDAAGVTFEVDRVLYEQATGHHRLELIENRVFGKVLLLDGAVQVTTADEFMYHEMLAHVPIVAHGAVRDVLIVGGGDCGLAEEVLKHGSIERVRQVEIDESVIDFSREHFAEFNAAAFADKRLEIEVADAAAWAARTDERFDVILVDSTDPHGPGAALFTEAFYRDLRRCLRPGGIVVTQSGVPFLQMPGFTQALGALSRVFATTTCYLTTVSTYFGGQLALGWGSDNAHTLSTPLATLEERAASLDTRYYSPKVHAAAFALPRYIESALDAVKRDLPRER